MSDAGVDGPQEGAAPDAEVVVYWRPGCPFCSRLLRWIDRNGVPTVRHDIWADPDGAAAVRAITGGDETVPTVLIAGRPLVNPSPRQLEAALRVRAPELLAPDAGDSGQAGSGDGSSSRRWWRRR